MFRYKPTIPTSLFLIMITIMLFLYGCAAEKVYDDTDNKIVIDRQVIYYTDNITSDEINALAESEFIQPNQAVKLDKLESTYYVYVIGRDREIDKMRQGKVDAELDNSYYLDARAISDLVYVGQPVVVNICDNKFTIYKSIRYDPYNDASPTSTSNQ